MLSPLAMKPVVHTLAALLMDCPLHFKLCKTSFNIVVSQLRLVYL